MGVTYVLENTKYAEGSPGYRIGELTACVVPNPPKGTHLACTSPTQTCAVQITASTAAGLRAAEWMEYHNLLGIEHYILYLDYPSKETQAVLDIYLGNARNDGRAVVSSSSLAWEGSHAQQRYATEPLNCGVHRQWHGNGSAVALSRRPQLGYCGAN
eukprot:scaffold635_cov535-Prasinococcus_capsulatus_cf.AAC.5